MTSDDRLGYQGWAPQPVAVRRRRWPRRLAITLLVLAGLFTAADRIGVGIAESQIASRIQTSQNLASKPSVTINGFPFLTQLIGMKLDDVSFDARGVVRNGVRVTDLQADLRGVKPQGGFTSATADQLAGTAYFDWSDLQSAAAAQGLDVTLADGGDGTVQVTGTVSLAGASSQITVDSRITLRPDNVISLKAVKVKTGIAPLAIPTSLDYQVRLGAMPLGMTLQNVRVSSDGVRVDATAQHITLTQNSVQ